MSDNLRRAMRWVFIACLAGPMTAAIGAVTFHLEFPDVTSHTGHYWDDPTYGADARAEIQKQLTKFGKTFAANETVTLTIASTITTAFSRIPPSRPRSSSRRNSTTAPFT